MKETKQLGNFDALRELFDEIHQLEGMQSDYGFEALHALIG